MSSTPPPSPLLDIRGLTVEVAGSLPTHVVVDAVDLEVGPAEAVGLVGESGSGKTTVLRAALRLLPLGLAQTAGTVRFDGRDLGAADPRSLREIRGGKIGVVWQDPLAALDPLMRVGEQVAETIRAHRPIDRRAARDAALELMRLVELPDPARLARAYPHELSGGQRQRVVIASAIGPEPRLLLADEPTTALDVTVQDQVLRLIERLRCELALGLLLVSHDLAVVGQTCDRVAVMYAGRIVETGPVAAVFTAPRHHYTAGLLAAVPDVDRPGVHPFAIPGAPPATAGGVGCAFAPRCAMADERCRTVTPALSGEGAHRVACHHPTEADPAGRAAQAGAGATGVSDA
jgi:oligopeptide/dipeptide ABC transporter ATP-binding protein